MTPTRPPLVSPHLKFAVRLAALMMLADPHSAFAVANPASVYCESRGGKVEVETAKDGAQTGICVFADGTRVNEWAYFRSTHRTTK